MRRRADSLGDPAVLERQVRRMLADERAGVLVSSFAAQWLHLRRMRTVTPDVNAFPGFDDNLRDALVRETELFVRSQIRDDRSVVDLLDADYTFVNERLARHYGIPNVYGSRFRRVDLPGRERRGLLGHGSVLTVTSLATRTSPVVRGKWVLENILGTPPPPPPPDVPDLAGAGRRRDGHVPAGAAGGAPRQPGVLELPRPDGPARLRPGELRRGRQVARHRRRPARPSILPAPCPTGPPSTAFPACVTYCWSGARNSSRPSPRSC